MDGPFTPDQCRAYAREFYRSAKATTDPEMKKFLLDLMVQWRQLAGRIERVIQH